MAHDSFWQAQSEVKGMEPLVGQVLHSRYQIEALLGQQMGRRTLLATDRHSGSRVAGLLPSLPPDTWP